jgi:GntR family transcriptional regulator
MLEPLDKLSAETPPDASILWRSGIPLYMQVAELLRRELQAGTWKLGEQIPVIDELMAHFRVSRITLRQALAELEKEGLVKRGQGRGTFVTRDATQERWLILPTEWNALINHVEALGTRFVQIESGRGRQPPAAAGAEGLLDAYWYTRRVNYTGETPYSLTSVFLDEGLYDKDKAVYSQQTILPPLAKHLKKSMGQATQKLAVSTADVELARHLQISVGMPVVQVLRRVWDRKGRMVYVADVRYAAQYLSIETTLYPPSSETVKEKSK